MKGPARPTRHRKHRSDPPGTPPARHAGSMAVLGHELDNVLNGLLGINRLLLESGLSPEQERWSRAIELSGRQLRRLVLAYRTDGEASGEGGSKPNAACVSKPLDGIELLEQAILCQAPLAARHGNRLVLTVEPDVPPDWRGDACRLRQLVDNLLGNANKFTDHGEIELHAVRDRTTADLLLAVTDTGPGVDRDTAPRLFDAWARGPEPRRGAVGGSGLGLYVCRQAIEAMGGTIRLAPPPGGGARFEVRLPGLLASGEPAPLAPSGLLLRLDARLDVDGALFRSLVAWLDRLGVRWCSAEKAAPPAQPRTLPVRISELPPESGRAGPSLLLTPLDGCRPGDHARRLRGPVIGTTLGPALLQMALEWLWFRDGSAGSVREPYR